MDDETSFLKKHKTKLFVSSSLIAGITLGIFITKRSNVLSESMKITQLALFGGKNVVVTTLERRGHPGYMVKHIPSGTVASSINHLSDLLECSRSSVYKMIDEGVVEVLGIAQ